MYDLQTRPSAVARAGRGPAGLPQSPGWTGRAVGSRGSGSRHPQEPTGEIFVYGKMRKRSWLGESMGPADGPEDCPYPVGHRGGTRHRTSPGSAAGNVHPDRSWGWEQPRLTPAPLRGSVSEGVYPPPPPTHTPGLGLGRKPRQALLEAALAAPDF